MANITTVLDDLYAAKNGNFNNADLTSIFNDAVTAYQKYNEKGPDSVEFKQAAAILINSVFAKFSENSQVASFYVLNTSALALDKQLIDFSSDPSFGNAANVLQGLGSFLSVFGDVLGPSNILGQRVKTAGIVINLYGVILGRANEFGENLDIYGWWQSVSQTDAKREAEIYAVGLAASLNSNVTSVTLKSFEDTTKVFIDVSKNSDFGIGESVEYIKNIRKLLGLGAEFTAATANDVYEAVQETRAAIQTLYGDSQFQISDISNPRNDFSAFLSLYYAIPFSIKPGDAGAMDKLYQLNATIADKWNSDRNLTPEQIANGEANFSDKWLADRTAMVAALLKANLDDVAYANAASDLFIDYAQNIQINAGALQNNPSVIFGGIDDENITGGLKNDHLYGMGGDDELYGNEGNDYIEGNAGGDKLYGEKGRDVLVGGTGNDTLDGGEGNDTLEGGEGNDTYQFNGNFGFDVISDSDGEGAIKINNSQALNGGRQVGDDRFFRSEDQQHTYVYLTGNAADGGDLLIDNKITIKNHRNGNLNITLLGSAPIPESTPSFIGTSDGDIYFGGDSFDGNNIIIGNGAPSTENPPYTQIGDIFIVGNGNNEIYANGRVDISTAIEQQASLNATGNPGNLIIVGAGGEASLDLGPSGKQLLYNISPRTGNNKIVGGAGNDLIISSENDTVVLGPGNNTYIGGSSVNMSGLWLTPYWWGLHESTVEVAVNGPSYEISIPGLFVQSSGGFTPSDQLLALQSYNQFNYANAWADGLQRSLIAADATEDHQALLVNSWSYIESTPISHFNPYGPYFNEYPVVPLGVGKATIFGGSGNNLIVGSNGGNYINVGSGNSSIFSGGGDDIIVGSTGNSLINGQGGNDYISVDSGDNTVWGGAGDNVIYGGSGNDIIYAGINTTLNTGTNTVYAGSGNAVIYGSGGIDKLVGGLGKEIMYGGAGDDVLFGTGNGDILFGGTGKDTIYVGKYDIAISNATEDTIIYLEPPNTETIASSATVSLNPSLGNAALMLNLGSVQIDIKDGLTADENVTFYFGDGSKILQSDLLGTTLNSVVNISSSALNLFGGMSDDTLISTSTNSSSNLFGGLGNDLLVGSFGNDILDGGVGVDTLNGGAMGDDIYYVDNIYDLVIEDNNSSYDIVRSTVSYTLNSKLEQLTLLGLDSINATGNEFDNLIEGNAGNNILDGQSGYDLLYGGAGDDVLFGGDDNDYLYGELGNDNLMGGSGDDYLDGGTGSDILEGDDGDDYLFGNSGDDTMSGGSGDDFYKVDSIGDVVIEDFDDGLDGVEASLTYTLGENLEYLYLTGTDSIDGTGNELDNELEGNQASNLLAGGVGDDIYYFGANFGHDRIDNAAIDNTTSTDTVFFYDIAPEHAVLSRVLDDLVITISASDSVTIKNYYANGNNKIDRIQFSTYDPISEDYVLTVWDKVTFESYVESSDNHAPEVSGNITPLNATDGSALNYVLPVSSLFADADPNDALTYTVTLADGNPLPAWLAYESATYTLSGTPDPTHIGNLSLRVVATDLAGATAGIDFDLTVAAMPDQTIIGTTANDLLVGGSGNDTLDGLAGTDTMTGGYGNDTYFVERATDKVIEQADQGIDTINTTITYSASANVENLTLLGTASITANGNELNNTLTGNTGNNTLDGKVGADSMLGGLGNDTYVVDDIGDVVTELENEGTDTVKSSVDYSLGDHVERLTLTGTTAIDATGNGLSNILIGNDIDNQLVGGEGNDNLNGGLGADTLIGGLGNDTYVVENVLDTVIEQVGEGTDTVQAIVTYMLAADVENLTLTGTSAINGTGNDLNNTLTGNTADNQLSGGAGNDNLNGGLGADTLLGGLGNDIYTVDNANDVVIELAGEGTDRVNSSIDYTLGAEVENLTLTGTVAISASGNELNNTLAGNTADNVLIGNAGNDNLNGGVGADTMLGGLDNDIYTVDNVNDVVTELVGEGTDRVNSGISYTLGDNLENLTLTGAMDIMGFGNNLANVLAGNTGNNYLYGLAGNDVVTGAAGNDILQGGEDNDTLTSSSGNDVLDAGAGADRLNGNVLNELLIGGTGNDTIITGVGYDVISFNRGDGADIISASTGADNTLSLGGNFAYSDLSLTKTGNNLILKMGATDQITFSNWYSTTSNNKSVVNLQVIAEAMQGFSLGGSDDLRNNKVESFNFTNLVAAFDAAGATANWQLTDARLTAHLQAGSDTAAIGGDLAYQYGKNSNLTGMGLLNAQSVINNANFVQAAQTLNNPSVWQAELVKMA